ncbi:MAG: PDZ domain-containing protein [Planctomycetaceae bacterium]
MIVALMLAGGMANRSAAAEAEPRERPRGPRTERQLVLKPNLYTNGRSVREAFRDIAAAARKATVLVSIGETQVAQGLVVAESGWVVTKASEVSGDLINGLSGDLSCELADGRKLKGIFVAADEPTDLALLKVDAEGLTPIEWETDAVDIGQWIINAGLEETPLSVGVVSALPRKIALVHIPGVLGIRLAAGQGPPTIEEVFPDRAAATVGMQVGDIIEQAQGRVFDQVRPFQEFVMSHRPGERLSLVVRRGEEKLELNATLSYPTDVYLSRIAQQNHMGGGLSVRRTGFQSVLQHDSVLAPAECGAAAVNLSGKAIGVNIARAGRTETYTLPAATVVPIIAKLMQTPVPDDTETTVSR